MSDVMFYGVLRMPYEMAMSDEMSRRQFYSRAQEAADRVAQLEDDAARRAAQSSPAADDGLPPLPAYDLGSDRGAKWWIEDKVRQVQLEAYEAGRAAAVPDSWKLVPVEPTGEQLRAELTFDASGCQMGEIYRSMLDAAPQLPKEKP